MTDSIAPLAPIPQPKAVVLMLGWLGSKPRQVRKYATLYHKRDCAVISALAPVSAIARFTGPIRVSISEAVKETAKAIRAAENKLEGPGHSKEIVPVVLHYFSNGGTYLAQQLEEMIQEAKINRLDSDFGNMEDYLLIGDRLHKYGYEVLDSAPAFIDVPSGYNALKSALPNKPLLYLATAIIFIKFMLLRFFAWMLGQVNESDFFWNKMIASDLCVRQAFLFSECDKVTNSHKLEELIEARKERGIDVKICKFDDSAHVLHLKKYPEEYEAVCAEVIETVTSVAKEEDGDDTDTDSVSISEDDEWWH